MPAPSQFAKLRDQEHSSRVQDNIDATLRPLAEALNSTPIMGAPPPPWIRPDLLNGFVNLVAVLGGLSSIAGYHRDALGYVHVKGTLYHVAGVAAMTPIMVFPPGYRPKETQTFPVKGPGAAIQYINITPDGTVSPIVALAGADSCDFAFSFLAEQ